MCSPSSPGSSRVLPSAVEDASQTAGGRPVIQTRGASGQRLDQQAVESATSPGGPECTDDEWLSLRRSPEPTPDRARVALPPLAATYPRPSAYLCCRMGPRLDTRNGATDAKPLRLDLL